MLANLFQLIQNARDGLAWLVQGIHIDKGMAACFAVICVVAWYATQRHDPVEPPRMSE